MKKVVIISAFIVVLAIVTIVIILYVTNNTSEDTTVSSNSSTNIAEEKNPTNNSNSEFTQDTFQNIKTPHYVSSTPANNELLITSLNQVSIQFNFDLANNSIIEVTRDGSSVVTGEKQISSDKLNMSVLVNAAQTGNYSVSYSACWPDGSCHQGSFGFSVKL
ncbi:MAG: copper resistance protein CopC [Candidatus Woykebacteria bacterium]